MWIKTALGAHSADLQSADCLSQSQQAAELYFEDESGKSDLQGYSLSGE